MSAAPIKVWRDRDGRLLRLRLARPKANIVDAPMIAAIDAALQEHLADPRLLGVLIDHEGPHFSFGASVEEHLPGQYEAMLRAFHAMILRVVAAPVPVLVAVRGQCLGGGMELAIAGTMIFAAPEAKFGQPEIVLGVFAPPASCILPERMPRCAAEAILFSGQPVSGAEAQRLGLVHTLSDDPERAALDWFDGGIAAHSPSSLRLAVKAARGAYVARIRARLAEAEKIYLKELMQTRDAVEGLTAFLEKRPAQWEAC